VLHKPLLLKEAGIVLLLLTGEVPRAVDLQAAPQEGRVAIMERETPSQTERAMRMTNLGSKEVVMEVAKEAAKEAVKEAAKEMAITAGVEVGMEMGLEDTGTGAAIKSNCFDEGVIGGRVQHCRFV
jgi:Lhr-like helicase